MLKVTLNFSLLKLFNFGPRSSAVRNARQPEGLGMTSFGTSDEPAARYVLDRPFVARVCEGRKAQFRSTALPSKSAQRNEKPL